MKQNTLIKWPGGKSSEFDNVMQMIDLPKFDRYVEPFFGGGGFFLKLQPENAEINDISTDLMDFYYFVKNKDEKLKRYLYGISDFVKKLLISSYYNYDIIEDVYKKYKQDKSKVKEIKQEIRQLVVFNILDINVCNGLHFTDVISLKQFYIYNDFMVDNLFDKMKKLLNKDGDLKKDRDYLITGIMSGNYMYFRKLYNDIISNRKRMADRQLEVAIFYFIREYCYGSMFRYNRTGEFNIPYGGMTYNKKNFKEKIDYMFSDDVNSIFSNVNIHNMDFEEFLNELNLTENDFIFLDPPYDSTFSSYDGKIFTLEDHKRLSDFMKSTKAKYLLLIEGTDSVNKIYDIDNASKIRYNDKYKCNIKNRYDNKVEYLLITNLASRKDRVKCQ